MGKLLDDLEREAEKGGKPLEAFNTITEAIRNIAWALTAAGLIKK